jgi:hypothetical protein
MKQIGAEIGVNESRVSQLHARAIQRLRKALGSDAGDDAARALRPAILSFEQTMKRLKMAKSQMPSAPVRTPASGVVLTYKAPGVKPAPVRPAPKHSGRTRIAAAR